MNPNNNNVKKPTNDETKKFHPVSNILSENSLSSDERLILNAPSNNRNNKVKVVKIGATAAKSSGLTIPKALGPIMNPNKIKNRTSGIWNFLKMNSANDPKKRIKPAARRANITTSITINESFWV